MRENIIIFLLAFMYATSQSLVENPFEKILNGESKISTISDQGFTFKVMSFNVNRAVEAEKYADTCWANREPRILQLLKLHDPDIICLQECRKLDTTDTVDMMYKIGPNYKYFTFYANPSDLALGLVIAYKRDKFFCRETKTHWLSSTPQECSDSWGNGWGRILGHMLLHPIVGGKVVVNKNLIVANTHFGLGEDEKDSTVKILPEILKKIYYQRQNEVDDRLGEISISGILVGDFNSFYDLRGPQQMENLASNDKFALEDWSKEYYSIRTTEDYKDLHPLYL